MKRLRGPVLAAVISAVVVVVAVVAVLLPRFNETNQKRDELSEAQQQEEALQAQVSDLRDAKRQAKALEHSLVRLDAKVPPTAEQSSLIRLLQGAADAASVDLLSVAPGSPIAGTTGISVIPMQVNVTGTFFEVEEFMFRLETLPRAFRVTQLNVGEGPEGLPELNLTVGAEVYTTDASAGPGSEPGPSEALPAEPVPTDGATPEPTEAGVA